MFGQLGIIAISYICELIFKYDILKFIYLYRSDLGRPFCNSIHLIFAQSLSPYMEDSLGQVNNCCQHSTLPNNAWHSKNLTYVVTFLQLFTLCFSLLDSVVGETLQ